MKERLLQKIADKIIDRAEKATTEKKFNIWYKIGMQLDMYCIGYYEIYLK